MATPSEKSPRSQVTVSLDKRLCASDCLFYPIEIGVNHLSEVGSFAQSLADVSHVGKEAYIGEISHVIVITDTNVEAAGHVGVVCDSLAQAGATVALIIVEPGEQGKTVETANQLWQKFLKFGADRQTLVVAVGGGVVGDLAGFVAATYARGIRLLQVPTSLLAQVDSSVGGKVGVNLPDAKNMVGAFWQPIGVWIDIDTLKTLPDREYRSGLGEVVKYGMALDCCFFDYLEAHIAELNARKPDVLAEVVTRCCRWKSAVVEADEYEVTGRRILLNYGHTLGHALETATDYQRFLHGEALAVGMDYAARLAESRGQIDASISRRQRELLAALGLPTVVPSDIDHDELLAIMQHDKKAVNGQPRFVLPTAIGRVALVSNLDTEAMRFGLEPQMDTDEHR